jgi:hypothetical protein
MAFMVPYRSNGRQRDIMARTLSTVGTRAAGRMAIAPPQFRRTIQPVNFGFGDLSCCADCAEHAADVPYEQAKRMKLGALGATSPLVSTVATGVIGKGAAVGASSLLAAAGAGSFAGPIGAAVGLVVGILSQKLFGHADYAKVANDVAARLKYAEAYKQVAGQYPGRLYGSDELKQVWFGLVHEGIFPKNAGGGWAPGTVCNINACIQGVRDKNGNCPGCGGSEQWATDLFTGGLVNKVQGFKGAIQQANGQGITNPIQIADAILIPAWAPPDQGSKNIKWASPQNSTAPSLVRQLFIDTLDAVEYEGNKSLPIFYGSVPGSAAPAVSQVTVAPPVPPPPVQAAVVTPPPVATPPTCPPGYAWNGTQCVLPTAQSAPIVSPGVNPQPVVTPAQVAAQPPTGYAVVASDMNGNPVFVSPQGVLYTWTGSAMQMFTGQLAPNQSAAAQMQTALQQSLAQGLSPQQAAASSIAQGQAMGLPVSAALQAPVAEQAAITAAAPTSPVSAGFDLKGSLGMVAAAVTILGFLFATARPKGRSYA